MRIYSKQYIRSNNKEEGKNYTGLKIAIVIAANNFRKIKITNLEFLMQIRKTNLKNNNK